VLDEAQKEPVVFEKIKYAFDSKALSFSVLLGSSQILLLKKVRESLAGRASVFEIWPLMMSEIHQGPGSVGGAPPLFDRLMSAGSFEQVLMDEPELLLDEAEDRCLIAENFLLSWGGMPALLSLSTEDRWQWLKDYEYTCYVDCQAHNSFLNQFYRPPSFIISDYYSPACYSWSSCEAT
jgi:hypothetical protein